MNAYPLPMAISASERPWPSSNRRRLNSAAGTMVTNVLDAIPKKHQTQVRTLLRAVLYAESQATCEQLQVQFNKRYRQLAPNVVDRLAHDWERLVTFHQFPCEHWRHLRTTNVLESPFAATRLRTSVAKRFKKVESATAIIWKMLQLAENTFRQLNALE